jgi:hypothetical protein
MGDIPPRGRAAWKKVGKGEEVVDNVRSDPP